MMKRCPENSFFWSQFKTYYDVVKNQLKQLNEALKSLLRLRESCCTCEEGFLKSFQCQTLIQRRNLPPKIFIMSYFKATMSMEVNLSKLSKRPTLGSFKISQCRGIPPNRFLTRLKTYEKLVGTRKKSIFGVFIPAPKIGKIKVKIPFKSVKISKSQISKHVMYTLSLINLILQNVRARFFHAGSKRRAWQKTK